MGGSLGVGWLWAEVCEGARIPKMGSFGMMPRLGFAKAIYRFDAFAPGGGLR